MSDKEEKPLAESRESGDMDKEEEGEEEEEEEYNPSFEEDRLQQSLTEGTLSWEESQEDGEGLEGKWIEKEEQIEGKEVRGEEEEMRGKEEREERWEEEETGEEEKSEEKEGSKEKGGEEEEKVEEEKEKSGEEGKDIVLEKTEESKKYETPIRVGDIVISSESSTSIYSVVSPPRSSSTHLHHFLLSVCQAGGVQNQRETRP